jgi:hypothetical protein
MNNGFWAGGASARAKGLREQFERAKQALHQKMAISNDQDRSVLEKEASELEKDYKAKLDGIEDCIF